MVKVNLYIQRLYRIFLLAISVVLRTFTNVKKGRVIMWSYYGKNYSCNPKAITEYLISNDSRYQIFWVFLPGKVPADLPKQITPLVFGTLKYLYIVNTSEFLCTNSRMFLMSTSWIKRKGQKYIMTWHSSMGLKCIEGDADAKSLGNSYIRAAKFDSKQCDLILSGSRARSEVIRRAFWYDGEILEKGTPRNDVFFDTIAKERSCCKVRDYFNIPEKASIILYAPTFRNSNSLDFYKINWNKIITTFKGKLHNECYVLVRLHPNLIKNGLDTSELVSYVNTFDATKYNEMQELLVASDVLITDYSSSMFDFAYINKPVFLYAVDAATYDRDTYFELEKLPFPFSKTQEELEENVEGFDMNEYKKKLSFFLEEKICSYEKGNARQSVYDWMQKKALK